MLAVKKANCCVAIFVQLLFIYFASKSRIQCDSLMVLCVGLDIIFFNCFSDPPLDVAHVPNGPWTCYACNNIRDRKNVRQVTIVLFLVFFYVF